MKIRKELWFGFALMAIILAAVVMILVPELMREFSEYRMLMFGFLMVLMMIWLPDGLLSLPDRLREKRDSRRASEERTKRAADMDATDRGAAPTGAAQ